MKSNKTSAEFIADARRVASPLAAVGTLDQYATVASVAAAIAKAAAEDGAADVPVVTWDCCGGFRGASDAGAKAVKATPNLVGLIDPGQALDAAVRLPPGTVLFIMNGHRYLHETAVVQALGNLRDRYKSDKRIAVLLGPTFDLPAEINQDFAVFDEPLPTDEVYAGLAAKLLATVNTRRAEQKKPPIGKMTPEHVRQVTCALRGLAAYPAEQALALCLTRDGFDVDMLWQTKRRTVETTNGLRFEVGTGVSLDDVIGLDALAAWALRVKAGPRCPGAILFLDEIEKMTAGAQGDTSGVSQAMNGKFLTWTVEKKHKGIMIVGTPGVGKSYSAEAIANALGVPLIKINFGDAKGSLVGESLPGDAEVFFCDSKGSNVVRTTMREAYDSGRRGYTFSFLDGGGYVVRRVYDVIRHDRKEAYVKIRTKRGCEVVVTEGHSLFVRGDSGSKSFGPWPKGAKRAGLVPAEARDVKVGQRIAVVGRLGKPERPVDSVSCGHFSVDVTPDLAQLIGLWLGDGSMNAYLLRISTNASDAGVMDFLRRFGHLTEYHKGEHDGHGVDVTINDRALAGAFYALDVCGRGREARTKRVPGWVFGMSDQVVAALLRGYFSADGSFTGHNLEVSTVSRNLAYDVALLMRRFGISPYISKRRCDGAPMYRLTVSKLHEVRAFHDRIGFLQEDSMAKMRSRLAGRDAYKGRIQGRVTNSVQWDEVVSIEPYESEEEYSYDLSVEETEKFVSGMVVVHNSERNMATMLKVIDSVGGDRLLMVATCNREDALTPELRDRFSFGTWYVAPPSDEAQQKMWAWYAARPEYGGRDFGEPPAERHFTGRDISNVVESAYWQGCSLREAARTSNVPIRVAQPKVVADLEERAHGVYLSAHRPGPYYKPDSDEARREELGGRAVTLEGE